MIKSFFKKKPVSLQPAIQKYDAIDSIVKSGAATVNYADCSVSMLPELWNIYPEKKHKDVLSNFLFYINFGNAAEQKKSDHTKLSFSVSGTDIKGTFDKGKITFE